MEARDLQNEKLRLLLEGLITGMLPAMRAYTAARSYMVLGRFPLPIRDREQILRAGDELVERIHRLSISLSEGHDLDPKLVLMDLALLNTLVDQIAVAVSSHEVADAVWTPQEDVTLH